MNDSGCGSGVHPYIAQRQRVVDIAIPVIGAGSRGRDTQRMFGIDVVNSIWCACEAVRRMSMRHGDGASCQLGVVTLVMNRRAIRRPLALPADGLHALLPRS